MVALTPNDADRGWPLLPIPEHGNESVEHAEVPLTEVKLQHCCVREVGPASAPNESAKLLSVRGPKRQLELRPVTCRANRSGLSGTPSGSSAMAHDQASGSPSPSSSPSVPRL